MLESESSFSSSKKKKHTCLTACFKYSRTHERTSSGFSTDTSVVTLTQTDTHSCYAHTFIHCFANTHKHIHTMPCSPITYIPSYIFIFTSQSFSLSSLLFLKKNQKQKKTKKPFGLVVWKGCGAGLVPESSSGGGSRGVGGGERLDFWDLLNCPSVPPL